MTAAARLSGMVAPKYFNVSPSNRRAPVWSKRQGWRTSILNVIRSFEWRSQKGLPPNPIGLCRIHFQASIHNEVTSTLIVKEGLRCCTYLPPDSLWAADGAELVECFGKHESRSAQHSPPGVDKLVRLVPAECIGVSNWPNNLLIEGCVQNVKRIAGVQISGSYLSKSCGFFDKPKGSNP